MLFTFWLRLRRRRLPTDLRSDCRIHRVTKTPKTLGLGVSVWKFLEHLPSQLTERLSNSTLMMQTLRITEFVHEAVLRLLLRSVSKRSWWCRRKMRACCRFLVVRRQTTLFAPRRLPVSMLLGVVLVWLDDMRVRHRRVRRSLRTARRERARSHPVHLGRSSRSVKHEPSPPGLEH